MEHKFDWALVDVQFTVEKGKITEGKVFSDCLVPVFIDALNAELVKGDISYDVAGVADLCNRVKVQFQGEASMQAVHDTYIPELQEWLSRSI